MTRCTCLEVFGEDPDCAIHGYRAVVRRLRALAASEHDDLSVADEGADIIEELIEEAAERRETERVQLAARLLGHPDHRPEPPKENAR